MAFAFDNARETQEPATGSGWHGRTLVGRLLRTQSLYLAAEEIGREPLQVPTVLVRHLAAKHSASPAVAMRYSPQ